jgi:hypothetical protein
MNLEVRYLRPDSEDSVSRASGSSSGNEIDLEISESLAQNKPEVFHNPPKMIEFKLKKGSSMNVWQDPLKLEF